MAGHKEFELTVVTHCSKCTAPALIDLEVAEKAARVRLLLLPHGFDVLYALKDLFVGGLILHSLAERCQRVYSIMGWKHYTVTSFCTLSNLMVKVHQRRMNNH